MPDAGRSTGPGRRSPPTGRRWPRSAPTPTPATLPKDPTYLSWTLAAVAPLPLHERQALLEAEDADEPAGHGHRPAARRAARDERDPLAARHRGRPHPLVAELTGAWAAGEAGRPGGTPATVALTRAGVDFTLHEYDHDPRAESYGLEAAEALGLDPARVFKTLMATVDGRLVVGGRPRSPASSTSRRWPARWAAARPRWPTVRRPSGPPGTSPAASPPSARSAPTRPSSTAAPRTHPTVFVSAGRRGLDLEIAPADLVTSALTHPVRR